MQRPRGPVVEAAPRAEDGRIVCPVCGLAFTTKHSLQQQLLRKHAAAEPIICSCGQPFRMPEDYDAHLKRPIHRKRMVRYFMYTFLYRTIILFINAFTNLYFPCSVIGRTLELSFLIVLTNCPRNGTMCWTSTTASLRVSQGIFTINYCKCGTAENVIIN